MHTVKEKCDPLCCGIKTKPAHRRKRLGQMKPPAYHQLKYYKRYYPSLPAQKYIFGNKDQSEKSLTEQDHKMRCINVLTLTVFFLILYPFGFICHFYSGPVACFIPPFYNSFLDPFNILLVCVKQHYKSA